MTVTADISRSVERCSQWTLEATVCPDPVMVNVLEGVVVPDPVLTTGVIAAVTERRAGCVRALVVSRGQLAVLGHSWRGGQALWPTIGWTPPRDWFHIAATSDARDLLLYANGRLVRGFTAGELFAGYEPLQHFEICSPARFGDQELPGWRGETRGVAHHDRVLKPTEIERRARAALGIPEPAAPSVPPARPPDPAGCDIPAHQPAWRPEENGLRCLMCVPPRGCDNDSHEPYWRPAGNGDYWNLACGLCETAAKRGQSAMAVIH